MDMSVDETWNQFLDIISKKTNPVSFNTWFNNLKLLEMQNQRIVIQVPMAVHKTILGDKFYSLIEETFLSLTGINYDIEFVLPEEKMTKVEEITSSLEEETTTKEDDYFESNLLPNLNFDNFVVGDTNRFAKTAAMAVAEQPGKIYNPLFIYGKSGLGKTHLMHAIGNYIMQHSDKKVLYTTSDDFMNDFTGIASVGSENSLQYANKFKNKYRNIDVLIIDDIQYLVGAEKTQQEFFHTFNALHQANKQIIISSDRSPEDLKILEERLRSRFSWGLPVDIFPPDFDLRCRILKNKIAKLDIAPMIGEDIIAYIANTSDNDVRSLEGAINRLVAYTAMMVPEKITLEFAQEALRDHMTKNIYSTNNIENIQKAVADYYGLTVEILKGKKRSANIAYPRQIAMYLCRMLTEESFPRIGLEFGGKDHSTVIFACDKIEEDLKGNTELKNIIEQIKGKL